MRYRDALGHRISAMTLGTVQLGMPYGISNHTGQPDRQTGSRMLEAAERLGINSFDTALLYGDAESVLGDYMSSCAPGPNGRFIVTKLKLTCGEACSELELERDVRRQMETSLSRLRMGSVSVYMLHHARDLRVHGGRLASVLERLTAEGLIGCAGVSAYGPEDVSETLRYPVFRAVQAPANLFDLRLLNSGLLQRMARDGIAVFIRSVFLQGLFFMNPAALPQGLALAGGPLANISRIAALHGMSVAQLAVSFVRDLPGVTSLVIGAERPEQVEETAAYLEGPPLPQEARLEIERSFAGLPEELINPNKWLKS